jgi:hypothetical protein
MWGASSNTHYGSTALSCDQSPSNSAGVRNGGAIPPLLHMSSWQSA